MVEHQPSKLDTWVRFPSPAFLYMMNQAGVILIGYVRERTEIIHAKEQNHYLCESSLCNNSALLLSFHSLLKSRLFVL